jgi:hypothetical protein
MRKLLPFALLFCLGCAVKTPVTAKCPTYPTQVITIPDAQVGKPLTVPLMPTPDHWSICGTVPPGMEVVAQASGLVVTGTPKRAGIFRFFIGQ